MIQVPQGAGFLIYSELWLDGGENPFKAIIQVL
jgi:hypothetical protein